MAEEKIERIYTVPLRKAYEYIRTKRAKRAVRILRAFLARHMKADDEDVKISEALNMHLWSRSMQKPPRKVKIKVVKENGKVLASLPDEKPKVKKERKKLGGGKKGVKEKGEKSAAEKKENEEPKK